MVHDALCMLCHEHHHSQQQQQQQYMIQSTTTTPVKPRLLCPSPPLQGPFRVPHHRPIHRTRKRFQPHHRAHPMPLYVLLPCSTTHRTNSVAEDGLCDKGPCAAMVNGPFFKFPRFLGVQPQIPLKCGWSVAIVGGGGGGGLRWGGVGWGGDWWCCGGGPML